jgi:sRNA-binding carbon storage regulator CsrA
VLGVRGNRVRLGINAPAQVAVVRAELHDSLAELLGNEGRSQETLHATGSA